MLAAKLAAAPMGVATTGRLAAAAAADCCAVPSILHAGHAGHAGHCNSLNAQCSLEIGQKLRDLGGRERLWGAETLNAVRLRQTRGQQLPCNSRTYES